MFKLIECEYKKMYLNFVFFEVFFEVFGIDSLCWVLDEGSRVLFSQVNRLPTV